MSGSTRTRVPPVTTIEHVELEVPTPVPVSYDPERTLLVLIDMENEFCDPAGGLYLGPEAADVVANSAALTERARAEGWEVVWLRSVRSAPAREFTEFDRRPFLLEDTWAVEYTPPLAVADGETVIAKRSHDCFYNTDLDQWLAQRGITAPDWTVLVTGVALSVCVNHAVLGFSVRDHRTTIVLDCVAPSIGPAAAATLSRFCSIAYDYNVSVSTSSLLKAR